MASAVMLSEPLSSDDRKHRLNEAATNQWHWAPRDLSDCYWAPRIAAHRVEDPAQPNEAFRVLLDEDFHHDSRFRAAYFTAEGELVRTVVTATPAVDGPQISRRQEDVLLLADNILEALKSAPLAKR